MFARNTNERKIASGLTAAYGAALWAIVFSLLHFVWAAGWYIGLDAEQAQKAFQQNWFLIYDIIAGVLCLFGAIIALAISQNLKKSSTRKIISWLAWLVTGLLILRGAIGIMKIIYLLIIEKSISSAAFWDIWFCVGAVLFSSAVWRFERMKERLI